MAKRLDLLRELLPAAARVAVLINPASPAAETTMRDAEVAARALGLQIQVLRASTSREINAAFATFVNERPDAVFVAGDPFFNEPAYPTGQCGLAPQSPRNIFDARLCRSRRTDELRNQHYGLVPSMGIYTGRVLKGAKPADLPVVQSSKFELVINAQTARVLGLDSARQAASRADEVIE